MTVSIIAMCDVATNGINNSGDACELIAEKAIMRYNGMDIHEIADASMTEEEYNNIMDAE